MILDETIDHRQYVNDIGKEYASTKTLNGMKQGKMTTSGWQLCIKQKYGSTIWVTLKYINQNYTIELEDYAERMKTDDEPAFAWWFPYVQKKR